MRPCGPRFVHAREPIHLNGLLCPMTCREEVPALLLKTQPAQEPQFPVRSRIPVRAAYY
ncbi:unnamed protein product [Staurois parvus]|uniref:Uncharacterized protein n=1 Tax=Staurois parvus TaxID=386267 RepID=A0ABN9BMB3_9NEOB|nr:unnamed protein product [Staurois parvus]